MFVRPVCREMKQFIGDYNKAGRHFFSEGAMKFFNSRIEDGFFYWTKDERLFITSEQENVGSDDTRYFTVRIANLKELQVRTVCFNAHRTVKEARDYIKNMDTLDIKY